MSEDSRSDRKRKNYIAAWLSEEESTKFDEIKAALGENSTSDAIRKLLGLVTVDDIVNMQIQELRAYTQI